MPLRLELPIEQEFVLEQTDETYKVSKDSPTKVRIKQASQGSQERRAALFANVIRELPKDDENIRLIQRFSLEELKRVEVFITLIGCNIEDVEGKPLFSFDKQGVSMSESSFTRAWNTLPPSIAQEIHEKVIIVNPDWDPNLGN